jgi:hypothetical protein
MTIAGQTGKKILIVNRVHNEWPADLVEGMKFDPAIKLVTRPASEFAEHQRGAVGNAVLCFPGSPDGNADERYAYKVTTRSHEVDLVVGIHGRRWGASFPFTSATTWSNPLVRGVASLLESDIVLFQEPPHEGGVLPSYVGLDLEPDAALLGELPGILDKIARGWQPAERPMTPYKYYGCVPAQDALDAGLTGNYQDFSALPEEKAHKAGLPIPCYAMCWDPQHPSFHGCVGEVLVQA